MAYGKCFKCGKPTNSHQIGFKYLCHTCYQSLSKDEIERMKTEAHKKNIEVAMELLIDGVPVLREE
jgi:tRNA(Ile2) C34 agmatinyltransferase TiaS